MGAPKVSIPKVQTKDKDVNQLQQNILTGINALGVKTAQSIADAVANSVLIVKANYSLTLADDTVLADATSANVVLTLPDARDCTGKIYYIKAIGTTNGVYIATTADQLLDDRESLSIALLGDWQDGMTIQSNGTNWTILDKKETSILVSTGSTTATLGSTGKFTSGSASRTLGSGIWRVLGFYGYAAQAAGTSTYVNLVQGTGLYAADGANNGTPPTALPLAVGAGMGFAAGTQIGGNVVAGGNASIIGTAVVMRVAAGSTQSVYAVPQITSVGTGVNVYSQLYCERLW